MCCASGYWKVQGCAIAAARMSGACGTVPCVEECDVRCCACSHVRFRCFRMDIVKGPVHRQRGMPMPVAVRIAAVDRDRYRRRLADVEGIIKENMPGLMQGRGATIVTRLKPRGPVWRRRHARRSPHSCVGAKRLGLALIASTIILPGAIITRNVGRSEAGTTEAPCRLENMWTVPGMIR